MFPTKLTAQKHVRVRAEQNAPDCASDDLLALVHVVELAQEYDLNDRR